MIRYFVGIDPHRDTHVFCVLDTEGHRCGRGRIGNSPEGFENLDHQLQALGPEPSEVFILLEAAGVYWIRLSEYLHARGYPVCVGSPKGLKYFAGSGLKRAKTDAVDARTMAEFARLKRPAASYFASDPRFKALHEWELYHWQQVHDCARVKNRLKRQPHVAGPPEVTDHLCQDLKNLQDNVRMATHQMEALEKEMGADVLHREIKGAGATLIAAFLAVVKDPRRFASEKQFRAYVGLAPQIVQSGRKPPRARLSKTGSARYRAECFMATLNSRKCHPAIRQAYERQVAAGKKKKVAHVYAMIKMTQLLFGKWGQYYPVLHSESPFPLTTPLP